MKLIVLSCAIVAIASISFPSCYADVVVDFGTGNTFYNAPYTEDGLTLTPLPSSSAWTIGPWNSLPNDNSISTSTNGFTGLRVASNVGLIDLLSFDVRGVNAFQATWQATSSTGAVFTVPSGNTTNTISFPPTGWTGISYFDISVNAANSSLRMDNIRFTTTAVPEPSSVLFTILSGLVIIARQSVRSRRIAAAGQDARCSVRASQNLLAGWHTVPQHSRASSS